MQFLMMMYVVLVEECIVLCDDVLSLDPQHDTSSDESESIGLVDSVAESIGLVDSVVAAQLHLSLSDEERAKLDDLLEEFSDIFALDPYLDYVISSKGVRPDPSKTEKVQMYPIDAMSNFLALHLIIEDLYLKVAALLHQLTKKNVQFQWTDMCETSFNKLKELLVSASSGIPSFWRRGLLHTDASGVGLGAVLSQEQEDGQIHPIAYVCLENS